MYQPRIAVATMTAGQASPDLAILATRRLMTWTWQLEKEDGTPAGGGAGTKESWGSQGDAESWLGENWRGLVEAGVDQASLMEDGRREYGPMSLRPPAE
jgi:hypothetical protein